jgi:hypothetical protein
LAFRSDHAGIATRLLASSKAMMRQTNETTGLGLSVTQRAATFIVSQLPGWQLSLVLIAAGDLRSGWVSRRPIVRQSRHGSGVSQSRRC